MRMVRPKNFFAHFSSMLQRVLARFYGMVIEDLEHILAPVKRLGF